MGPRLVSRGNIAVWAIACSGTVPLQWGRGLLAAEIAQSKDEIDRQYATSMGPRLVSRGNHLAHYRANRNRTHFNGAAAC